ncbi:MAG: esterase family protein [Aureispira sp.]|nr:esterase family protein [Aureispira sp.]
MKILLILSFLITLMLQSFAQQIDTLEIESEHFEEKRTVYIHKPQFYKYKSENGKLPVYYILDGQHKWFVDPTLNTIKYLQYTHDIPQAIIVVIPLKNRYKECPIDSLEGENLPLHSFITEELSKELEKYGTNGFNLLVGHSFSASFALYSYSKAPDFYSAIFAHSPLDKLSKVIAYLSANRIDLSKIFLSVGGAVKDNYHRENCELLKKEQPEFFEEISYYEANYSSHTSVPIVANPIFFSQLFELFKVRYDEIAEVDLDYKLIANPSSIKAEKQKMDKASIFKKKKFLIEVAEINGIASRYWHNEFNDHAIAIYNNGIKLYPKYYEFHINLGELYLTKNKAKAKKYLKEGKNLFEIYEQDLEYKEEILDEINELIEETKK